MGQPKLLLPWAGHTVIDQVLDAWTASSVERVVIIVRRDDTDLRRACEKWPVTVVSPPQDPEDMKASLRVGVQWLEEKVGAVGGDACFLSPADIPGISHDLIEALLECYRRLAAPADGNMTQCQVVVPRFGERPGHPSLFRWDATKQIATLAEDEGLNRLIERLQKRYVDFSADARMPDIDTPAEYRKLRPATWGAFIREDATE